MADSSEVDEDERLSHFSALTGADEETGRHVLEAHGWDLNASVDFFLENSARPPPAAAPSAVRPSSPPVVIDDDDFHPSADTEPAFTQAARQPFAHPLEGLDIQGRSMISQDVQRREAGNPGSDLLELPDGINAEEARMLEAAMFGTAYQGPIPDFNNPTSAIPADPDLVEQRLLIDEQDAAYQASLQADRDRMEADAAAREQEVLEARRKEEEQQSYHRLISNKKEELDPEPAADAEGAVQIQVRLPDGTKLSRIFTQDTPLSHLFTFVDVKLAETVEEGLPEVAPGSYSLATQFPRRVFGFGHEGTLSSNGLDHKQEALFLQT